MNNLSAGFARVNITSMTGINLAGYFQQRIADGVGVGLKESEAFALVMPVCMVNGEQGYFFVKDSYDEGGHEAGSLIFRAGAA